MINTLKKDPQINTYKWANLTSLMLLIIGLFIAFTLKNTAEKNNALIIQNSLEQDLNKVSQEVKERVNKFEYGLQGLRGAINTIGFEHFNYQANLTYFQSRDYAREFPGARGMGVIKMVPKSKLAHFLQRASLDRGNTFSLTQLDSPQDPLFVVQYIEPEGPNKESVGLDIGSEVNRRRAAISSAIAGTASLTAPITLVQADNKVNHGFLLLLPIFAPQNTIEKTMPDVLGWVYTPLLINEILASLTEQHSGLTLEITDINPTKNIAFFSTAKTSSTSKSLFLPSQLTQDTHQAHRKIEIYGRHWQISLIPSAQWIANLKLADPQKNLIMTLGSTLLLIIILHSFLRYITRRMENIRQKISLSSFIDNASDGLIGVDSSFTILHWNHSAEVIFNLNPNSSKKPFINYLSESISTDTLIAYFKKVARGEPVSKIEFNYQPQHERENRSLVLSITPLIKDQRFLGASFTINDVSDFKLLQSQLQQHNIELKTKVDENTIEIEQANLFQQNILNSSKVVIIATDAVGLITFFSSGAEQSLRFSHDEMVAKRNLVELIKHVTLLNPQDDNTHSRESMPQAAKDIFSFIDTQLKQYQHITLSCDLKQKYGEYKQVNLHVSATMQRNLGTTGFVFVAEDLTEKNALHKQLHLLNSAINCSRNMLLWVNSEGDIILSNKHANTMLGYSATNGHLHHIDDVLIHENDQTWHSLKHRLLNAQHNEITYKIHTLNSPSIDVIMSASLINMNHAEFIFIEIKAITATHPKAPLLSKPLRNERPTAPPLVSHHNRRDEIATQLNEELDAKNKIEAYCQTQHIDYQGALSRLSHNNAVYLKALELFIEELTQYADTALLENRDNSEFKILFHSLKSSAATLGFTHLAQFAKQQEAMIKADDKYDATPGLNELTIQINQVKPIAKGLLELLHTEHPQTPPLEVVSSITITNETVSLFNTLIEEVNTFNMNATNTFPKLAHIINALDPENYSALKNAISNLKFQQAEQILKHIQPLLLKQCQ